jgi:hypothetical protein
MTEQLQAFYRAVVSAMEGVRNGSALRIDPMPVTLEDGSELSAVVSRAQDGAVSVVMESRAP